MVSATQCSQVGKDDDGNPFYDECQVSCMPGTYPLSKGGNKRLLTNLTVQCDERNGDPYWYIPDGRKRNEKYIECKQGAFLLLRCHYFCFSTFSAGNPARKKSRVHYIHYTSARLAAVDIGLRPKHFHKKCLSNMRSLT